MRSVIRKPNIKKSISSRTTGRVTRTVRKISDPTYGKKGIGYIKNPKKALYNEFYNATSYGLKDISNSGKSEKSNLSQYRKPSTSDTYYITNNNLSDFVRECPQVVEIIHSCYIKRLLLGIVLLLIALLCIFFFASSSTLFLIGIIFIGISIYLFYQANQYRCAYKDAKKQLYKINL